MGGNAHALVMSATPIPRTLAQSFFGVSDCSSIKSKPQNRKPIQTSLISAKKRDALLNRVLEQASEGHQVYWVCPRVDNDDDAMSALQMFETVQAKNHAVKSAVLHGRMKAEEKMAVLESFSKGDVQLLVSTVVIEVGVDVPAATIMVIDHAQVFGLAQLHQLRGRVGRSDLQAYCILLYREGVTEEGVERLQCLKESNDGFELAEKDLALRGPGHILGFRQSGYPAWRFLQWPKHKHLIAELQQQKQSEPNLDNHYLAKLLWSQQS
jgi:ATP-dependent DNA helicase RecG